MSVIDSVAVFREHGWVAVATPLWDNVSNYVEHFDAVVHGKYETGVEPQGINSFGSMVKVSNAHLADETIKRVVFDKRLSKFVARCLGAEEVYLWADSLYWKAPLSHHEQSQIGWHQDKQYWGAAVGTQLATVCIPLYNAHEKSGGLRFADGSHKWGLVGGADALTKNDNMGTHQRPAVFHQWEEVCPKLPPGGFTIHHCLTFHGSGANEMITPRRSITIHMMAGDVRLAYPDSHFPVAPGELIRGPLYPKLYP